MRPVTTAVFVSSMPPAWPTTRVPPESCGVGIHGGSLHVESASCAWVIGTSQSHSPKPEALSPFNLRVKPHPHESARLVSSSPQSSGPSRATLELSDHTIAALQEPRPREDDGRLVVADSDYVERSAETIERLVIAELLEPLGSPAAGRAVVRQPTVGEGSALRLRRRLAAPPWRTSSGAGGCAGGGPGGHLEVYPVALGVPGIGEGVRGVRIAQAGVDG